MTSRQRNSSLISNQSTPGSSSERPVRSRRIHRGGKRSDGSRQRRRQHLLETLESRQLLAGPQLIGIQPNQGELIDDGAVRQVAPRVLTFRFDEDQRIDANTLGAIQITRSGRDGQFGTADDVPITPGLVALGDPNENEVIVRFADSLPDDNYRINIFGYDDPNASPQVVGLRNLQGELIQPSVLGERVERIDFKLNLGALVEAVVPQPVSRNPDGSLTQNRDEIVVYFNEDPLFVENDAAGNPTLRSAENPRFYQLLLTQDTVRTTDDLLYWPEQVIYDEATHTARLIFETDINNLPGVPVGGGTFRLRLGTAVDAREDLIVPPLPGDLSPSATVPVGAGDASFKLISQIPGEDASGQRVSFRDSGAGGLSVSLAPSGEIVFDFGGSSPVLGDLQGVIAGSPLVNQAVRAEVATANLAVPLPRRLIDGDPVTLVGLGDTLSTALDIGVFSQENNLTSLVFRAAITPQDLPIELPGGDDDPGHRLLVKHINEAFGADQQAGITEIPYNFKGVYFQNGSTSSLNQITPTQKTRIREVLQLWSSRIGVQFYETADEGITFALGETSSVLTSPALPASQRFTAVPQLQASVRVDPAINDNGTAATANAAIVFSNQANFGLSYGEDFTRKAAAGVGFLLGLLAAPDQSPQVLMALSAFNEEALLRRPSDGSMGQFISAPTTNPADPAYQRFDERFPEFRGFLNDLIDPITLPKDVPTTQGSSVFMPDNIDDFQLPNWEPVFPSNVDVLHGQHIHRPDSVDVDLYRFEIDLNDANRIGQLSVETFAERLADSSGLDTTLTLFQETRASATTDLRVGPTLRLQIEAVQLGANGNGAKIEFVESDRQAGDTAVRVHQARDANGSPLRNAVVVDLPRRGRFISSVPVGDLIAALQADPLASSLFTVSLAEGAPTTDISGHELRTTPIVLTGGGLEQLSRNDDYFSNDSFLTAQLGAGVYYIGVAASGNDTYDPMIKDSGFGGLTQGEYELRIKFEPQVDEVDVIRDRDASRPGVPGTPLDGDGDGVPRGVHNFWFQTRPEQRSMTVTLDGDAITPGQTLTIVGAQGATRTYEFVPAGGTARPGNVTIPYRSTGSISVAESIARELSTAINGRVNETGVRSTLFGATLTLEGERSLKFSTGFRGVETLGRQIFVDKTASTNADGTIDAPFNNINNPAVANAFGSALRGDIVRIVGNGGADQNPATEVDNFAYQFGIAEIGGRVLEDGRDMEVPAGVTTMIDAGAIFKMRSSRVSVGSSGSQVDRSGGALQVLGTPRLVDFSGTSPSIIGDANEAGLGYDDGSVIFTSTRDKVADRMASGNSPTPRPGDWGGLVFRRDVDQAQGRRDFEDEGIFLQTVNHAEIRYGGASNILVDAVQQLVNPIQLVNLRPNISFNKITHSADAAMSAAPDSFLETTFGTPAFQQAGEFTPDYNRVGPDIHNNTLTNNSINGIFIRTIVTPNSPPTQLTSAARFDDTSIVHVIAENLVIAGTPGGSITDGIRPSMNQSSAQILTGGMLPVGAKSVAYLMTFVDGDGFESAATEVSKGLRLTAPAGKTMAGSGVSLAALPGIPLGTDYVSRRLYRAEFDTAGNLLPFGLDDQGNPQTGYRLVADLDGSSATYTDDGSASEGTLDLTRVGRRGRLDASLVVDPGMVVKLQGARIELGHGAQLLAEGSESQPVVFTSSLDDRYGAGGTFDTNNDSGKGTGNIAPTRGNWSGIYAGPNAYVSLDHSVVAFGGGISLVEGGESRGFAPLELQQAGGRVTNSRFEFNQDGQDGSGHPGRGGRLAVDPSVIFVRGSQPVIVANDFVDNRGSTIAIDVDSMVADYLRDPGRQTGRIDRFSDLDDNHGPLIRQNRYEIVPADNDRDKQISGLVIRGGDLLVESVWDDTDIVHVLHESVTVGNIQSSGGLRLQSRANESLVVKLAGGGTPNSPTLGTGITATGATSDSDSRIGGTVQIIGLPGAPVVMTSLKDDTVGAGLSVDGTEFTDTNGDSYGSRPASNDWRSVLLDQYSNDRNVDFILEQELPTEAAPGRNGIVERAQVLGELAADLNQGDENRRLGFAVSGYLSAPNDVDTYSFVGSAGTEIWVDVNRTSFELDTVLELLDANGRLLARSVNSRDNDAIALAPSMQGKVGSLHQRADEYTKLDVFGNPRDAGSVNPRDAGFHLVLPGSSTGGNNRSSYFIRVRSASNNPDDPTTGGSSGNYQFQVRLQEDQEFPGSVVRFADIRFANHGVHLRGLPGESPLLGEAGENESIGAFGQKIASNDVLESVALGNDNRAPQNRPQYIGNLLEGKNPVISVAGSLSDRADVDFFQIDLQSTISSDSFVKNYLSTIFDIDYASGLTRPDTNISVFYDADGEFGPGQPQLVLFGADSNVAEDQTSPFGEGNDLAERLARGSISTSDPMIGPVSLPEGTYYVAVSASDRLPNELFNRDVRREPINSVQRLFEDRIDTFDPFDGFSNDSVFGGPRYQAMFDDAEINGSGFQVTTARGGEFGHGMNENFDDSNVAQIGRNQILYSETGFSSSFAEAPYTSVRSIPEAPRTPTNAIDLNALDFSLAHNPQIGGRFDYTADTIPHVSIEGGMGGDIADFYQLVITDDNTRVIIDVDEGYNPYQGEPGTPEYSRDFNSVDVDLVILDAAPSLQAPGRITDSNPTHGELGSLGSRFVFSTGDVIGRSRDPFFDGRLDAGVYYIGILETATTLTISNGAVNVARTGTPTSGRYLMHVSVEGAPVTDAASGTNSSLFLDRNAQSNGELQSVPFDLQGYVAADLPRFYFNYLWDSPSDEVRLNITSLENPTGITLSSFSSSPYAVNTPFGLGGVDFIGDGQWRQQIVDLGAFAGHSEIRIEFEYESGANPLPGVDGLFLDDFIVGFAERGETIFNAVPGETEFLTTGASSGPVGEYQLETRRATNFAIAVGDRQVLTRSFDTNDRHAQEVTLIVPDGSQISDGDTFTLSDGKSVQVFEFDTDGTAEFGNQRVPYLPGDSAAQVAMKLRTAINASSQLDVEAASASGLDTQVMTGNRLNLTGVVNGSFDLTATTYVEVPATGLQDGDLVRVSDGNREITFEFDSDGNTQSGNHPVSFVAGETASELTDRLADAINATVNLRVDAEIVDVDAGTPNERQRVWLFGATSAVGSGLATAVMLPQVRSNLITGADGRLLFPAVLHNGLGDSNYKRIQSQVLIENNVISDVHAIGIWSDPGDRGVVPADLRGNPGFGAGDIFGLDKTIVDPHPFLQQPPVGNPAAGVVRNLPTLNNSVQGGLTTGVVVRNNTIDQAGLSGIKIQGQARPFVIDTSTLFNLVDDPDDITDFLSSPSLIADGYAMAIDAGGTRVVFEFEDVAGALVADGGSGVVGGNGWTDGHVPIYYRHPRAPGTYNNVAPNAGSRGYGYNSFELMLSIQQAIQGSILVTNDMAELVTATLGPSPTLRNGFFEQFARNAESFPTAAVYLEGVSNIYFTSAYARGGSTINDSTVGEAAIAEAPQPFARVINNTIYGADGTQSLFPGEAAADANDVLADATVTHLGTNHTGPYIQTGAIGYNIPQGLTDQTIAFRTVFEGSNVTDRRTAVVGIGTEFSNINGFATDGAPITTVNANINVSNASIAIDYTGTGVVDPGTFNGYIFEGDFSKLQGVEISPASTVGADVSFTATQLRVNLIAGQTIDANDQLFLTLIFPERSLPAALAGVDDVNDVDLYKVELGVGDRLVVDISTDAGGPDTIVQIFDQFGERQTLNFGSANETKIAASGVAPGHLNPRSTAYLDAASGRPGNIIDQPNGRDPFVDFTALKTGTYYVGVSSRGNDQYDPNSLSGRTGGVGGTGEYEIGMKVFAPRQFVMSLDNESETQSNQTGTRAGDLVGTTFTITQIPDFAGNWPNFPVSGGVPNTNGNRLTFEFTNGTTGIILPNGNYNIPLITSTVDGGYRVPEIMDAISNAINGLQDPLSGADIPALPNHENGNGPGGRSGPVTRVTALALGGQEGDNAGIVNLSDPSRRPGITRTAPPRHYFQQNGSDFFSGFGHDRQENLNSTIRPGNTLTDGFSTTELYVLFKNAAEIELSPEAIAAGLKLTTNDYRRPNNNRPDFAENSDQLIIESGIWVTGGASPTLLNNVLSNLHQSIVVDETNFFGFGKRVQVAGNDFIKPQEVIVNGNVFQHDESRNSEIRFDVTWPIDPTPPFDVIDTSLSTDDVVGATNVTLQSGDFNFFIDPTDVLFADAQGNNFMPAPGSRLIDSATSSLNERGSFSTVKAAVGLPTSNILAPDRDVNGILRADNPLYATPGGLGQTIFKDRGSNELADFVGPVAVALNPRDNDAAGLDRDAATGFIQLASGPLGEFRIQLLDTGDASDPFTGIGVDDSTVKVAEIAGLRKPGANVTLFENDKLLVEGRDYRFVYDSTSNTIALVPLAGVWREDRSYRISLNNRDRSVLIAPDPSEVADGDQIRVTDSEGGTVVFEFESGYQVFLPEAPTLIVPEVGTEAGGLRDGDIFLISDGANPATVFEFDTDGVLLPGSRRISLPTQSLVGERVGLQVGGTSFVFQFVAEGGAASGGAIAVPFDPADPIEGTIFELCQVIQRTLSSNGIDAFVAVPDNDLSTLLITRNSGGPTITITEKPDSFTKGTPAAPTQGVTLQLKSLPAQGTPTDPIARAAYLNQIARSIEKAITQERRKDNETGDLPSARQAAFDFQVEVDGNRVVLGAPAGFVVDTAGGGLVQDARTMALRVPAIGSGINGIADGDSFTVGNGKAGRLFEFTTDAQLQNRNATAIRINSPLGDLTGAQIAELIRAAVADAGLGLTPTVQGTTVYLNLPTAGTVSTSAGQLRAVGISRPVQDGNTIRLSRAPEPPSTAIQVGNSFPAGFEVGAIGTPIDGIVFSLELREGSQLPRVTHFEFDLDSPTDVTPGNIPIDVTETIVDENGTAREYFVSRDELARRIAAAIPAGLNVAPVAQDQFVFITVPAGNTARIIADFNGIGLTQTAAFEQRQTLEFDLITEENPNGDGVTPGHVRVPYTLTDTASDMADKVAAALNTLAAAVVVDDDGNPVDADGDGVADPLLPGLLDGNQRVAPGQVAVNVNVDSPLTLTVSTSSSLEVRGKPGVSGSSTVQVFGPLLLNVPILGGNSITNGGVFVIKDPVGNDVVFQFAIGGVVPQGQAVPGAIVVRYSTADDPDVLADNFAAAINASPAGVQATVVNGTQISLGRTDRNRVSNLGLPGVSGTPAITIVRGIVGDGEVLRIRQGNIAVSYEFDSVDGGGGVQPGNVQVSFQPSSTPGDIAESLAAAIRNNPGGLQFTPGADGTVYPIAELDENGTPTGAVILNDLPGTQVDISAAPTLSVTGVPGGAIAIPISPQDTAAAVKRELLRQLNSVGNLTTLAAEDRGGNTLFVENASIIVGSIQNYFLPAIKDKAGNNLEPNRADRTTQFTIYQAEMALDFGDAPDPLGSVPGRYPTSLQHDGARHVIGNGPTLGRTVDAEPDAHPVRTADGDDLTIAVSGGGGLFATRVDNGVVKIDVNPSNAFDTTQFDGETFTIDTGSGVATFEFDIDGIFNEDNYPIWIPGYHGETVLTSADTSRLTRAAIAAGIERAIAASPIRPADVYSSPGTTPGSVTVAVSGNDEDGVIFGDAMVFDEHGFQVANPNPQSIRNPLGTLNKGSLNTISVFVGGFTDEHGNIDPSATAVVDAWIDLNADGDWDDPGEKVIDGAEFSPTNQRGVFQITIPQSTATITGDTYARFRVSRNGVSAPTGLALSGEVEDYRVRIVNGTPPSVPVDPSTNLPVTLVYDVDEGGFLQASDDIGLTQSTNDDGLLLRVTPKPVEIFAADIGAREVYDDSGQLAGTIDIMRNGTFTFDAAGHFSGTASLSVLAIDPNTQLVSSDRISVTIRVRPVNDKPELKPGVVPGDVTYSTTINEDNVVSQADQTSLGKVRFKATDLITPFYSAGPGNEPAEQDLFFRSAGTATTAFRTSKGGSLSIADNGLTILYTPPLDYSGPDPDTFEYTVADRSKNPSEAFDSKSADVRGRVEILINPINDNPWVADVIYQMTERTQASQPGLTIPIWGTPGGSIAGLLDNSTAGPPDEVAPPQSQTIALKPDQFTSIENGVIVQSRRTEGGGGRIEQRGNVLVYTPRVNFSGLDRFTFIVRDSLGAESTGTATINVGGVNKQPVFVGVRGQQGVATLEFEERKRVNESVTFDLSSWFSDADGDALTFPQVSVQGNDLITASVNGTMLTIDFVPYASGTETLIVRATDGMSPVVSQTITVKVLDTPDAPVVAGSLQPTVILEDTVMTANLRRRTVDGNGLFFDPDVDDTLTYRIARLGSISNPTASDIAASPLISSIKFIGDTLQITPKPDQAGQVQIEIEAFDGMFINSHSFDFIVLETADPPRGNVTGSDKYTVPVGGSIRITDPAVGLLHNDYDPDPGSTIEVAPGSLTQPAGGTGTVRLLGSDGTFEYTANTAPGTQPVAGQTDVFTYRLIDDTGRLSAPIPVNITYGISRFQNPVNKYDVTGDGHVTALDALRILNLLNRTGASGNGISVNDLHTTPPDYFDVSGDGFITATDVLQVINQLNARDVDGTTGGGEPLPPVEQAGAATSVVLSSSATEGPIGLDASLASTQAYASVASLNLGSANLVARPLDRGARPAGTRAVGSATPLDEILTAGFDIQAGGRAEAERIAQSEQVADSLAAGVGSLQSSSSAAAGQSVDSALLDLFSDDFETD